MLSNGIVGELDVTLFWRESGRRITAEERLETAHRNVTLPRRSGTSPKLN